MRIPPSVIVMSLLTAVPFGLAVKDTLASKHAKSGDDDIDDLMAASSDADRERMLDEKLEKEMAEERAHEQEREAAEKRKLRTELKSLYGAEPATMGAKFARVPLGDSHTWPVAGDEPDDSSITLDYDKSNAYEVAANAGYGSCDDLGTQLSQAWGEPTASVGGAGKLWVNEAKHQNAFLDDSTHCELRFVQTADMKQLFAKSGGLVPLGLVGAGVDKLDRALAGASPLSEDPNARVWSVPGIGKTGEATRIEVGLENNKVTSIVVSGTTDDSTFMALVAHLTTVYGSPKADGDQIVWKRPSMTLSRTGQSWLLVVGG